MARASAEFNDLSPAAKELLDGAADYAIRSGLPLKVLVKMFEDAVIQHALRDTQDQATGQHARNVSAAARRLGIHRNTLIKKLVGGR